MSTAMEEMQYLMNVNSSICQAVAKTMKHLTEFVFISMGNLTLARQDSYLARSSTVVSCYVNPHRNSYLQLIDKNAIELVHNQTSLGFFNRLFLVPKPNHKCRPILDLSKLNLFLKTEKFKMETPETIGISLQQGEWATSIDCKDAYFHIPIQKQSRKYKRFHVQG